MLEPPGRLPPDYRTARAEFLAAASAAGAAVHSTPHPLTGLHGEELAVDVAVVGPDRDATVLVVSATHGVEGFGGSMCQTEWLRQVGTPPDGVGIVMVHAHNPYGFSHVRRVDEHNVDQNRNWIDFAEPPPVNEGYGRFADLLVPEALDQETIERSSSELVARASGDDLQRLQAIITGGQYDHPGGVFYGGTEPTWCRRTMERNLGAHVAGAGRVAVLDLHTGLGPRGHGELISHEHPGSPAYARTQGWYRGEARSNVAGESVSAALTGDWLAMAADLLAPAEVTSVAIEWGTVDGLAVFDALRADAWLHAHGDPRGPEAEPIRQKLKDAFAPDDPAWVEAVVRRFDQVLGWAFDALRT